MTQSPPTQPSESVYDNIRFDIRIPKSRIAVLIGHKGETKRELEEQTGATIEVDSKEGDVVVSGKDAVTGYVVKDIVKAIGRGFNPEFSLQLLKPDYAFELIDLSDTAKSKNAQLRIKGRIIGKQGKSRNLIEKLMEVRISVFGKTVGIIGELERVTFAKQAIEMLIEGSPHANVYSWLEKKRKVLVKEELSGSGKVELKDEFQKYV